ncbi:methanogenesis marker 6 protein [Methanohalobium sp.]|uniref:methanogenesis marker 6 protein n=1 Tax=Methanohalobium sp. TaxID=2837493 RepID=UPI0025E75093|nr:methanogenesis marker 6 protein [Methanohalobium sp.]
MPENNTDNNNHQDTITKLVVIDSDWVLPSDAAMKIYESETEVTVKETCFGLMVNGPTEAVNRAVEDVVSMDRNHIFVKQRGFPPGDERRCRAVRGGGPRPGYYFLREEVNMLPTIGKALDDYDKGVSVKETKKSKKLKTSKLKDIIESNVEE